MYHITLSCTLYIRNIFAVQNVNIILITSINSTFNMCGRANVSYYISRNVITLEI